MNPHRPHLLRHYLALLPLACSLGIAADAALADTSARKAPQASAAQAASTERGAARKGKAVDHGATKAKTKAAAAKAAAGQRAPAVRHAAKTGPRTGLDYSGRKRVGKASFYAGRFAGRKMADGTRLRMHHPVAASKTLPLGTIAKVTNLRTGKSAVVQIRDRGPYVKGRIVDLTPATARAVGLTTKEGVAPVAVTPIRVPLPDGRVKLGEAAQDPLARTLVAQARTGE